MSKFGFGRIIRLLIKLSHSLQSQHLARNQSRRYTCQAVWSVASLQQHPLLAGSTIDYCPLASIHCSIHCCITAALPACWIHYRPLALHDIPVFMAGGTKVAAPVRDYMGLLACGHIGSENIVGVGGGGLDIMFWRAKYK